jgi:hypothetical protein
MCVMEHQTELLLKFTLSCRKNASYLQKKIVGIISEFMGTKLSVVLFVNITLDKNVVMSMKVTTIYLSEILNL